MIKHIPKPISGGLILSYKCPSACRHCIYACSPQWGADWIAEDMLETVLGQLAGKILPAPSGPDTTALNYGLHFTGGEPFVNFRLLCQAVEVAEDLGIPSTFVETNCFWCVEDRATREKLESLKRKGLKGILISVNPFYLEYVPFERTVRATRLSLEIFGKNTMVYQAQYFHRFMEWGLQGRVAFEDYLRFESAEDFARHAEFFVMGRAPYKLKEFLRSIYPLRRAHAFFSEPCLTPFLRPLHNHFDNYGNYVPGFCAGVTLGDCRKLDSLLQQGVDTERFPVLGLLMEEDMKGLLEFAREHGYEESAEGYFSKCHLCMDLRKNLARTGNYPELSPTEFYTQLEADV